MRMFYGACDGYPLVKRGHLFSAGKHDRYFCNCLNACLLRASFRLRLPVDDVFGSLERFSENILTLLPRQVACQCGHYLYAIGEKGDLSRQTDGARDRGLWQIRGQGLQDRPTLEVVTDGSSSSESLNEQIVRQSSH